MTCCCFYFFVQTLFPKHTHTQKTPNAPHANISTKEMNLSIILYKYKQRHTDTDVMYFTKYRYPPPHSFLYWLIIVFERLWPPAEYLASIVLIVCSVIFDDRELGLGLEEFNWFKIYYFIYRLLEYPNMTIILYKNITI